MAVFMLRAMIHSLFNFLDVNSYPEEQHPPPPLWTWGSSSIICTPRLAAPGWLEPLPFALSSTCAVSIIPKRGRKQKLFQIQSLNFPFYNFSILPWQPLLTLNKETKYNKHFVSCILSCKFKKLIASLFVQMYNGHRYRGKKFWPEQMTVYKYNP